MHSNRRSLGSLRLVPEAAGQPQYALGMRLYTYLQYSALFREFVLDWMALAFTKVYNVMVIMPRWLLLLVSGGLASGLVNILHRSSSSKAIPETAKAPETKAPQAQSTPAAASTATSSRKPSGGAKQRKGGKK